VVVKTERESQALRQGTLEQAQREAKVLAGAALAQAGAVTDQARAEGRAEGESQGANASR